MILLAPGPVPISKTISRIADINNMPYFRGQIFAQMMLDLTENLKYLFGTKYTPLSITCSGTGLMEMAIVNLTNPGDEVIVINGGNFGKKWVQMCSSFGLSVREFKVDYGKGPDLEKLSTFVNNKTKALFINAHETSTGYLYDLRSISQLINGINKDILFIVDGVSSIGADEYKMDEWGIDCSMVCSQKALAAMPGMSFIVFSDKAKNQIKQTSRHKCYFDAIDYEKNISRGMTPFTPAVVTLMQVSHQLEHIRDIGINSYVDKHRILAKIFRDKFNSCDGFGFLPERPSNALTALMLPKKIKMMMLINSLKDKYDWWLAPNPINIDDFVRVSHMGDLSPEIMIDVANKILELCND